MAMGKNISNSSHSVDWGLGKAVGERLIKRKALTALGSFSTMSSDLRL
jgi:hypothetical protein